VQSRCTGRDEAVSPHSNDGLGALFLLGPPPTLQSPPRAKLELHRLWLRSFCFYAYQHSARFPHTPINRMETRNTGLETTGLPPELETFCRTVHAEFLRTDAVASSPVKVLLTAVELMPRPTLEMSIECATHGGTIPRGSFTTDPVLRTPGAFGTGTSRLLGTSGAGGRLGHGRLPRRANRFCGRPDPPAGGDQKHPRIPASPRYGLGGPLCRLGRHARGGDGSDEAAENGGSKTGTGARSRALAPRPQRTPVLSHMFTQSDHCLVNSSRTQPVFSGRSSGMLAGTP